MVDNQLNSLRQSNKNHDLPFSQNELMEISNSASTDHTLLDSSEKNDSLHQIDDYKIDSTKDFSNICSFCKKNFCNEKYLQIHISKQHKFL